MYERLYTLKTTGIDNKGHYDEPVYIMNWTYGIALSAFGHQWYLEGLLRRGGVQFLMHGGDRHFLMNWMEILAEVEEWLGAHQTVENLLAMASLAARDIKAIENNFFSTTLMMVDNWRMAVRRENIDSAVDWPQMHADRVMPVIEESAECGLMQLGFLERGLNVPSTFIMDAYKNGWRFKGGFYRVGS